MSNTPRILAFAGSTRQDSLNRKLLQVAIAGAREAGAVVTCVDLRDYPLPLYDGDLEAAQGLPEEARKLRALFLNHDALLIASPEYNGSLSALLKNTLDWVSRPGEDAGQLACFKGKVAAILSASPGALGGMRGLRHLRTILSGIQVFVIPTEKAVPQAGKLFNAEGELTDAQVKEAVVAVGAQLAGITRRLGGPAPE